MSACRPKGYPVTEPSERIHLAVALDGAGWHPAAWREPDARPAELFTAGYWTDLVHEAERGLLDFVTIEDALGLQSDDLVRARRANRPGPGPARRGADRGPGRADAPSTSGSCRRRSSPTPSRSTCPRRSPPSTTSARAGPASGSRSSARPTRPRHFGRRDTSGAAARAAARRPGGAAAHRRAVRRGRRLRRGAPPALGQLGGRRRDPRCRHRPVRRPRQAALHRLRGPLVLGEGAVDHAAAAAGPADRRRAGPRQPVRTSSSPRSADVGFVTPRDAADAPRDRRRDPSRAARGRTGRRDRARLRRPGRLPRRQPRTRPHAQRRARTSWPAPNYTSDATIFAGTAGPAGRPAPGMAARPG